MQTVFLVVFLILSSPQSWSTDKPIDNDIDCSYNLTKQLALSMNDFDQNYKGGWRVLSDKGCFSEAADLIALYREENLKPNSLLFHEAQMRASAGDYTTASQLMTEEIKQDKDSKQDHFGASYYLDATLAFFLRDREALIAARKALENHPKPEGFVLTDRLGNVVDRPWPPNLNVVKCLEARFDLPYNKAYGVGC